MALELAAPSTNRPYAPPSNVTAVLQRLRTRNLPERVDVEYLRDAGVPEGTINRVMFAIRFLGLVGGADEPTPALKAIATSTDEEYESILAGLVRDAYKEVFESLDPAQDSQDRIVNFFRRYTPGSQRDRMVMFFLGMCREAGIETLDAPRRRTSAVSDVSKSQRPASRTVRRTLPAPRGAGKPDARPKGQTDPPANTGNAPAPSIFGITEGDLALLEEHEFDDVWAALGKVVGRVTRARARATAAPVPSLDDIVTDEGAEE